MDIGEKIKQRRKELGLTLDEVAEKMGVGKSTVQKWESGRIKNMRRDKIEILAQVLDISPLNFVSTEQLLEETVDYLQKEVNTLNNIEKVYGANIKNLVCKANELNEIGINKLYEYCCDLLEIPKYLKATKEKKMKINENK